MNELATQNGGTLPDLYLSGETHDDKYCKIDKVVHIAAGRANHLYVGLEGAPSEGGALHTHNNHKDSKVFGIDDPLTNGLGLLYKGHLHYKTKRAGLKFFSPQDFIAGLRENPLLKKEWFKLRAEQKAASVSSAKGKAIAEMIDEVLTKNIQNDAFSTLKAYSLLSDDTATEPVINGFTESVFNSYNNEYRQTYGKGIHMEKLDPALFTGNDDYHLKFMLDLRNEFMAQNISKLYCEAAKAKKPLFVIVGSRHVAGLNSLLAKMSQQKIKIIPRDAQASCENFFKVGTRSEGQKVYNEDYSVCRSINMPLDSLVSTVNSGLKAIERELPENERLKPICLSEGVLEWFCRQL